MTDLTSSERKHVADLLWQTICRVREGQTPYWTEQQLLHIARLVEPPAYSPVNKPLEAA